MWKSLQLSWSQKGISESGEEESGGEESGGEVLLDLLCKREKEHTLIGINYIAKQMSASSRWEYIAFGIPGARVLSASH